MDSKTLYKYRQTLGIEDLDPEAADLVCSRSRKVDAYNMILASKKTAADLAKVNQNFAAMRNLLQRINCESREALTAAVEKVAAAGKTIDELCQQTPSENKPVYAYMQEINELKTALHALQANYACIEENLKNTEDSRAADIKAIEEFRRAIAPHNDLKIVAAAIAQYNPKVKTDPKKVFPFGLSIPDDLNNMVDQWRQDCRSAEELKEAVRFQQAVNAALKTRDNNEK